MNHHDFDITRRCFVTRTAVAGLAATGMSASAIAARSQAQWKTAIGMNGFASVTRKYQKNFAIEDVLSFASEAGFQGVELVENWPHPSYPHSGNKDAIKVLREKHAKHNLEIFAIQTGASEAFSPDAEARKRYIAVMRDRVALAKSLGCSCIGMWPYGPLRGQKIEQAIKHLGNSFGEVARIADDHGIVAAFEIEPPFVFNEKEHWTQILEAAKEPKLKIIYDPSHFDLMNGSTGNPHEMLQDIGVEQVGYIHFTDTDGTLRDRGTSKHLPAGDGHINIHASFQTLRDGGFEGWFMIDAWEIPDPYDAGRKGIQAIHRFLKS